MPAIRISGAVVSSILFTGILLNFMGRGSLGTTAQKIAQYVTEGYGK